MIADIEEQVRGLLLAATDASELTEALQQFLAAGGRSVLFGESREEYVARQMSAERVARESPESLAASVRRARELAGPVLVAVDQEVGGIQRLAHLLPPLAPLQALYAMDEAALQAEFSGMVQAAKQLGVNVLLAPIVDTLSGPNPWLQGRTMSADVGEVARLGAAYVAAAEAADVMAVVKHFPGHAHVPMDPAVQLRAMVEGSLSSLSVGFPAFEACVAAGAGGMMLGPAPVPAIDASTAATCSSVMVSFLRSHFKFEGLVVSDGLEAAATAAGRPLAEVAVQALNAGVELLLVSADERLPQLVADLAAAVDRGELDAAVLHRASERVEASLQRYALTQDDSQ